MNSVSSLRANHLWIKDRAILDNEYQEWCKSQIPVAKANVQSFITFLSLNGLWNDDAVHRWVDEKENG